MNQREELDRIIDFMLLDSCGDTKRPNKYYIDRIMSLFAPRPIDDEAKASHRCIGLIDYSSFFTPVICTYSSELDTWFTIPEAKRVHPTHYLTMPEKLPVVTEDKSKD